MSTIQIKEAHTTTAANLEKIMKLTTKGKKAVTQIRERADFLRPEYKGNTMERVIFEFSSTPASVVMYAFNQASHDDLSDMVRKGYAER